MAVEYKCPNPECPWTDLDLIETGDFEETVRLWMCAGCSGRWPLGMFKQRRKKG